MSANTYCLISETDMDSVLKADKGWNKTEFGSGVMEIVYEYRMQAKPVVIKVYSSIKKNGGISRGVGQDAIRVCAVSTVTNKGIRKVGRINRVPGWQARLKERVIDMIEDIKKH